MSALAKLQDAVHKVQKAKLIFDKLGIPNAPKLPDKYPQSMPPVPSFEDMVKEETLRKEQLKKIRDAQALLKKQQKEQEEALLAKQKTVLEHLDGEVIERVSIKMQKASS